MKLYEKEIDGEIVRKNRNKIVLSVTRLITDKKTGETKEVKGNVYNPKHEMLLEHGWVEYVIPTPTEDELLGKTKMIKISELIAYDDSSEINDCIIVYQGQELHYWANKSERDTLKGAVRDCLSLGRETYRLDIREQGISFYLNCEKLLQMLAALEVYAIDCYNKTTDHEYAIKALPTAEEVEAYDYRVGYPEKLRFEL